MSLDQPDFLEYIRSMFMRHGSSYDEIQDKLGCLEDKQRMATLCHFYYFICTPNKIHTTREELQIVGVTSLIEAVMSDIKYMDPFQYFEWEYPKENSIPNLKEFKEKYLLKYGANKKIILFFQKYIPKTEVGRILDGIKVWEGGGSKFRALENLDQLAKFLYQMRSDFVHKADMQGLNKPEYVFSMMSVGNKFYEITVSIQEILDIFERGFVNFWKQKVGMQPEQLL